MMSSSTTMMPPDQIEARIALPARSLALWMVLAAMLVAGTWSIAIAVGPWGVAEFVSGLVGIVTVTALALAGLLVMTPWKPRPIADWMTMWLGATVFRVLLTPVALFLIYSAASSSLGVKALGLAAASTYLVVLIVEAAMLSGHMKRFCPPAPRTARAVQPVENPRSPSRC